MTEILTKLQGDEIIGLILGLTTLVGGVLTTITVVLSYNWRVARVTELETQLKRELIAQGRPGTEIAEIIQARPGWQPVDSKCAHHQRPQA